MASTTSKLYISNFLHIPVPLSLSPALEGGPGTACLLAPGSRQQDHMQQIMNMLLMELFEQHRCGVIIPKHREVSPEKSLRSAFVSM
jgi:hypothetical protein